MSVPIRQFNYGERRKAKCLAASPATQVVVDEIGEMHLLVCGANDPAATNGDEGFLIFVQGGITGGYWKFQRDAQ